MFIFPYDTQQAFQDYCTVGPAHTSFDFPHLLFGAVQHEDEANQVSPLEQSEDASEIPIHLRPSAPSSHLDDPSTPPISHLSGRSYRQRHANRGKKEARKRKRKAAKSSDALQYCVPRTMGKKHVNATDSIRSELKTEGLPAASTGFVGKREVEEEEDDTYFSLDELVRPGSGFRLVEHEPRYVRLILCWSKQAN